MYIKQAKMKIATYNLTLSALCLALAMVIPFFTGQIPQIGSMLCPMHIPVLLCGFLCGAPYGMIVGMIAPILRSAIFGMPGLFPTAICMSFELATYGLIAGLIYAIWHHKKWQIYVALVSAMLAGRVVWGLVMFVCMGLEVERFGWSMFIASAFTNAVPGIILQLVVIPPLVLTLNVRRGVRK